MNIADELSKLAHLREAGILTEAEFQIQKSRLLGSADQQLDANRRSQVLDDALLPVLGAPGVRVLQKNPVDGTATIQTLYAKTVNHMLHLVLSVLTGGLWILVWIVAILGAKKGVVVTERISVTADGQTKRDVISSSNYAA